MLNLLLCHIREVGKNGRGGENIIWLACIIIRWLNDNYIGKFLSAINFCEVFLCVSKATFYREELGLVLLCMSRY